MNEKLIPIHPGEILLEEFLKLLNLSQYRLVKDIQLPPWCINGIVHGKRVIKSDAALRLTRYFDMSDQFWINLQMCYDFEVKVLAHAMKEDPDTYFA